MSAAFDRALLHDYRCTTCGSISQYAEPPRYCPSACGGTTFTSVPFAEAERSRKSARGVAIPKHLQH